LCISLISDELGIFPVPIDQIGSYATKIFSKEDGIDSISCFSIKSNAFPDSRSFKVSPTHTIGIRFDFIAADVHF
jgi:hypothetical protein